MGEVKEAMLMWFWWYFVIGLILNLMVFVSNSPDVQELQTSKLDTLKFIAIIITLWPLLCLVALHQVYRDRK